MPRHVQSFLFLHLSILTVAGLAGCSVAHDAASATYYAASTTYHAASTTYHATSATYHAVTAPVRIIERNVGRRPPPGRPVETTATTAVTRTPPVQFPIAERVPGKSGLVMSPFDPEARYVDVSGYASGTKVKDPWTEKIFIVP
jgi:hypothetical protein